MEARLIERQQAVADKGRVPASRAGGVVVTQKPRRNSSSRAARAPFSLRCGALLIDYTLAVAVIAFATLVARTLGGSESLTGETTLITGYLASLAVLGFNFLVLPVFLGATVGKWATGLRIVRQGGEPLGFGHATLRHTIGYLVSLLTLGIGFLLAIFDAEGRTLHDRIAGTVVVRERAAGVESDGARTRAN